MEADGAARRAHHPLSEHGRVESVRRRALRPNWADIAKDLGHNESAIHSFFMKREQSGCLQKPMGRPRAPGSTAAVIELTHAEARSTLRDVAVRLGLLRETVCVTRHRKEDFKPNNKF
jgi:hypothetical protein